MRKMVGFPRNQAPFAMASALTKTVGQIAEAEQHEMRDVFNKPTPYTLSSVYTKSATKANQTASVGFKDFAGKGTPATKFLAAQMKGGTRKQKRFERALQSVGALPSGYYVVPGSAAKLDSYGNIDRGLIVQLLAYFRAFPEMGYKANMSDKRKAALAKGNKKGGTGVSYFVGKPGGGKSPLGIWARYAFGHGSAVKPVLIFVSAAQYEAIFDFYYVAELTVKRNLTKNMVEAMGNAMRSAR
jgi:hypothetical protein